MMTGVVAGSIGLGAALGVTVLAPTAGLATDEDPSAGASLMACVGVLGSGPIGVAAETIGIEPGELLVALRDGRTIAEVAEEHGVAPEAVIDAIVASQREMLDAAVESGRLTREQADAIAEDLEERATELVNDRLPMLPPWGHPGAWGFADGPLAAAAEAIGVDAEELLDALRDGRTIAEVAEEHGVDVDAVIEAIVAALQERLDDAVENGWITQDEADERAAELEDEATRIVNGDLHGLPFPGPGLGGPGWRRGPVPARPGWFLPPIDEEIEVNTADASPF
jgi:uncharacterized protein (DUF433 family)